MAEQQQQPADSTPASPATEEQNSGAAEATDSSAAQTVASGTVEGSQAVANSEAAASGAVDASQAAASEVPSQASSQAATASKTGASAAPVAPSTPPSSHKQTSSVKSGASSRSTSPAGTRTSHRKRIKLGDLDLKTAKIGFIGAGKMTESIIDGLIHYAKVEPKRIHVAAPTSKGLERFKSLGCRVTKRNYDIFGRYDCEIVFLSFHGNVIKHCFKLGGQRPHPLTTNYIPHQRHPVYILSLVSGVSLRDIKACLLNPDSSKNYVLEVHRIMMNTAVSHGLGICAVDCEPDSKRLSAPIRQLLSSIAHLEYVPASQMDAACAIGGSGLAFSFYFIQALADGAFKMGLAREQAIRFASKTAQCAAQTMLESGKHPVELRDNVSSPSGAAIYGIHVLEKTDVASGVVAAVEAAHKRANDLATQDTSSH